MRSLKPLFELLVRSVERYVQSPTNLVIPVSGGTDSALTYLVCVEAIGRNRVRGLHIGSALLGGDWHNTKVDVTVEQNPYPEQVNIEPYVWARIMTVCENNPGTWPVGTRNRQEHVLGTYSRPSTVATVLPIVNVWKTTVIDLCRYLAVPEFIIEGSCMVDERCGRCKQMVDIGYEKMDLFAQVMVGELPEVALNRLDKKELEYLRALYDSSQFKNEIPFYGPVLG